MKSRSVAVLLAALMGLASTAGIFAHQRAGANAAAKAAEQVRQLKAAGAEG